MSADNQCCNLRSTYPIQAAIQTAKDSLKILGADSNSIARKQRLNNDFDNTPDSLALNANPVVRVVEELSKALYAIEAHFDLRHIVNQIQDEINGLPQTQAVMELNIRFGETFSKYKFNPAAQLQPGVALDSDQLTTIEEQKKERDKLDLILQDLVNIAPGGNGTVTRHDFNQILTAVEGVSDILTLTANVPSILARLSDPNHPDNDSALQELDAMLMSMGSITNLISTPLTNKLGSLYREPVFESLDKSGFEESNSSFGDNLSETDVKRYLNPDEADSSKGENKSVRSNDNDSPIVKKLIAKNELLNAAAKQSVSSSPMKRVTKIGSMLNKVLRNGTNDIVTELTRPFLEGSGKVASITGMLNTWADLRSDPANFFIRKKLDTVMKLQLMETFRGKESTDTISESISRVLGVIDKPDSTVDDVFSALQDNGFKGIVDQLTDVKNYTKESGHVRRKSNDIDAVQHITNMAARSVFTGILLNNVIGKPNDDGTKALAAIRNTFNNSSLRFINMLSRNTPTDQTTAPLVKERQLEYAMLVDIIDTAKLQVGDNGHRPVDQKDVLYAQERLHALALKGEEVSDSHIAAIMGNVDGIVDIDDVIARAQSHLNDAAKAIGAPAQDINWSWVSDKLTGKDPLAKVVMDITRQHLPDNPTTEDVATTFTVVASVMELHDLAFPSNNPYTQKLYGQAIEQSKGAYFHKRLQEFVTSKVKREDAMRRLKTALDEHRREGDHLSEARKGLTEEQLFSLNNSRPEFKVLKSKSGNLRVQMTINVDGQPFKITVKDQHLISNDGARLGLNISQVHQLNYLDRMEGLGRVKEELSNMNPSLNDEEIHELVNRLDYLSSRRFEDNGLLFSVDHVANLRSSKPAMESIITTLTTSAKMSADSMINTLIQQSPDTNITHVQFSMSHDRPTVTPKENNPFDFILHVPYAMIGKPSNYSDGTEKDIMNAQIAGFVEAFTEFNTSKDSPIDIYTDSEVLKLSRKQHKQMGTDKVMPVERTRTREKENITAETADNDTIIDPLLNAQMRVMDILESEMNDNNQVTSEESLARIQAVLDIADTELLGNDKPETFGEETVDLMLAAKEAPPLEALTKFAAGVLTKKEIEAQSPSFGQISPAFKNMGSLASKNPEDLLSPTDFKKFQILSQQIKRGTKELTETRDQLNKLLKDKVALSQVNDDLGSQITDLRTKARSGEIGLRNTQAVLDGLTGQRDLLAQATTLVRDTENVLQELDTKHNAEYFDALVKGLEKIKDGLGIKIPDSSKLGLKKGQDRYEHDMKFFQEVISKLDLSTDKKTESEVMKQKKMIDEFTKNIKAIDDRQREEYHQAIVKGFNQLTDKTGMANFDLQKEYDMETFNNAIEAQSNDRDEYEAEINQARHKIKALENKHKLNTKLMNEKTYQGQLTNLLARAQRVSTNLSNRVKDMSVITDSQAGEDLLQIKPDLTNMFNAIPSGGLAKYLEPEIAERFNSLGFGIETRMREGKPIKIKGPNKYQSIYEPIKESIAALRLNTDSILDYETMVELEWRLEKITEAAEWLHSIQYEDKELSPFEIKWLNRMADQHLTEILG